jgi:hypothetical protein
MFCFKNPNGFPIAEIKHNDKKKNKQKKEGLNGTK